MPWTERQRAMLAEMGVPLWLPPQPQLQPQPPVAAVALLEPAQQFVTAPVMPIAVPHEEAVERHPTVAPIPAAPSTLSTLDWPALREAVASCRACKLCDGRRQTVFGVGHQRAHWMVVGEAPGEQEDIQGEPFVGKSGQLLDNMLRSIRLTRKLPEASQPDAATSIDPARQVYIANTLKCRPPGNRNPEPDELAKCEAYLVRQIELVQPKIILAMGRFAVQSLLRSKEPIGRLRGRVHRYQGVPLIVTYHPAYLLRNLEDKARAWEDLCLALDTVESLDAVAGPAGS